MKRLIYLLIFFSFFSCKKAVQKEVAVTMVEAFPATIELKSDIINVPPVILAPANMFIYDNQLVIMYNKKDTVFDFFQLPECQYLYSAGIRGGGPDDLPVDFDNKFTRVTTNGFYVFSSSGLIREYRVYNGKLINCKEQRINLQHLDYPINGFKMLSDSVFISWSSIHNHQGYEFVHINTNKNENTLFSAMPQWLDSEWSKDMQPFVYVKNTVVHPSENKFAAFYAFFKQWRIYDNTELIHDISVHIPPYSAIVEENIVERIVYYHCYPYASEKYIYAICKNKKYIDNSNRMTELQIWEWDGTPVAVLLLDKKIDLFTISEKDNKIYAINSDEGYEDTIYIYSIP